MNNKGFMMAEVIVVSSIILTVLVGLYVSYNKVFSLYNKRINYYDVPALYDLAMIKKNYYKGQEPGDIVFESMLNEEYTAVVWPYYRSNLNIDLTANVTDDEYLKFLDNSLPETVGKILIIEKCKNGYVEDCKYAYLEVFDEETS